MNPNPIQNEEVENDGMSSDEETPIEFNQTSLKVLILFSKILRKALDIAK